MSRCLRPRTQSPAPRTASLPGIDLAAIGVPGCSAYLVLTEILSFFSFAAGFPGPIATPYNTAFAGVDLLAQTALIAPRANAPGFIVSDAAHVHLDLP